MFMRSKKPELLLKHIDMRIEQWLKIMKDPNDDSSVYAPYYIDAYQDIRLTMFGKLHQLGGGADEKRT